MRAAEKPFTGIDSPFSAEMRASRGVGVATDWELLQIYSNDFSDLQLWKEGVSVPNPFK